MLKTESKRRRTKQQIEEAKTSELDRENDMRTKMARLDQLQSEKEQAELAANNNLGAAKLMSDLINAGVVKQVSDSEFVAKGVNGEQSFDFGLQ